MKLTKDTFSDLHVLVIGDVMIDQYLHGQVFRKSPEADIPVLENVLTEKKLGGAANVAKNLVALGAKATLLSVCGDDHNQILLGQLLEQEGINSRLISDPSRKTTVKTRVFSDRQQIVRVDEEDQHDIGEYINESLIGYLEEIIRAAKIDVIILQDYNKGVLCQKNIRRIISIAKEAEIFIAVDPKNKNIVEYRSVDLFKPNLNELANHYPNLSLQEDFQLNVVTKMAEALREEIAARTILVTLSDHGAMILTDKDSYYKDAEIIDIVDVCGAGDAVIAICAMLLLKGINGDELLTYCNQTGRIVCQKTGVAPIHINDLIL